MEWCYGEASVTGVSHIRLNTRLQDAKQCFILADDKGKHWFVAIISDGAGSANFGGQGAAIICRTISIKIRDFLSSNSVLPDDETISSWIETARQRIQIAANKREIKERNFAATMIFLMASSKDILIAHVGDGAVVAREKETLLWTVLSKPHHGEYASTTYFVTDDLPLKLRISRYSNQFNSLVAFSDGIENLVIDNISGEPFPTFFNPITKPFEHSARIGKDVELSKKLALFLNSDRINERTDDDKTLIIAVTK